MLQPTSIKERLAPLNNKETATRGEPVRRWIEMPSLPNIREGVGWGKKVILSVFFLFTKEQMVKISDLNKLVLIQVILIDY